MDHRSSRYSTGAICAKNSTSVTGVNTRSPGGFDLAAQLAASRPTVAVGDGSDTLCDREGYAIGALLWHRGGLGGPRCGDSSRGRSHTALRIRRGLCDGRGQSSACAVGSITTAPRLKPEITSPSLRKAHATVSLLNASASSKPNGCPARAANPRRNPRRSGWRPNWLACSPTALTFRSKAPLISTP